MAAIGPFLTLILLIILTGTFHARAVPYDYSFTQECLAVPLAPQYEGGIAANPEVDDGLNGWTQIADATVQTNDGNSYYVATLSNPFHNQTSTVQEFQLDKDKFYTFSVWLQVSKGNAYIESVFTTQSGSKITAAWGSAQQGCWSMVKGGLVVDASGTAQLFFKSADIDPKAKIYIDSISLQPFTKEEWASHRNQSAEKVRKRQVRIQVKNNLGAPVSNAKVWINQSRPDFPLGSAMNGYILNSTAYQNWFASRFRYTVFENEMKWYITEETARGQVDYTVADAMLQFVKSKNISLRGHTVHWDTQYCFPKWFTDSPPKTAAEFLNITFSRVQSIVNRYKGQVIHWDVVNENIHNSYIEDNVGPNGSAIHYSKVHEIDPHALNFLNEFRVFEHSDDGKASPRKYLQKIADMRKYGYQGPLGIGLQGHFSTNVSLPYVRASMDVLASANLPIWITELDIRNNSDTRIHDLEQLLREFHAHEAVQGIMLWTGISSNGTCYMMCLTDKNFNNFPAGDVVDKIIDEWTYAGGVQGTTDAEGYFQTSLFHGQYEVSVVGDNKNKHSHLQHFDLVPTQNDAKPVDVMILA